VLSLVADHATVPEQTDQLPTKARRKRLYTEATLEDLVAKQVRDRGNAALNETAETIGAALGRLAARLSAWKDERATLAADIQVLAQKAQAMLDDVGTAAGRGVAAATKAANKGGRPKGYKMSEATKAKLRAAWKRRKAQAAQK
jgi:hypothetical protein